MNTPEEIINKLKDQIEIKKVALEELKTRYREVITSVTRNESKSPNSPSNYNLESLQKQLSMYDAEKKLLTTRLGVVSIEREIELTEKIKNFEEKLALLVKENFRLNKSGNSNLPPIQKSLENEEDLLREVKFQKKNIVILEDKISGINNNIEKSSQKISELEYNLNGLKMDVVEHKNDIYREKYNELHKKLDVITKAWKSNVLKFENNIKELESFDKSLQDKITQLKSKIIKQDQQRRLLNMSHDDYAKMKKDGEKISDTPNVYHPDVSFLYKPSVKALYST
ncbi:hypothetical protein SteCoe_11108 [Stentor coeruleus]|uniref:Uncharacterized protein n=1 Tax=Stentor coeruleus TaxID=5963 RepID=A0A1R2CDY5_9CILI|nr:hypothetical protein SteCoe_11108 [Stentor coeruleus]